MGFWDTVKSVGGDVLNAGTLGIFSGDPGTDAENARKQQLYQQAQAAGQFAGAQQNQFRTLQGQQADTIARLKGLASGQNSVSAEQLRQAAAQNQAQQLSIAAGAGGTPNAAAAARTAAIQAGRIGAGLAGQQAIAGIQERNAAANALTNALGTYGGQALSAAQSARGQALQGYGAAEAGAPEKSWIEKYGPAILGGASVASDRRLKRDVKEDDAKGARMLDGLKGYSYRYRDERHGEGEQFGPMAQDLERAGMKAAVIDTPAGKMVHGARLATINTGMLAGLNKRVRELEKRGG